MNEQIIIHPADIVGKKVKEVSLIFKDGRIISSLILIEDGSSLRIDPMANVAADGLFVMSFPSQQFEWNPAKAQ